MQGASSSIGYARDRAQFCSRSRITRKDICSVYRMTAAMQPDDLQVRSLTHLDDGVVHRMAAAMQPNDVQGEESGTCGHACCAQNDSSHAAN